MEGTGGTTVMKTGNPQKRGNKGEYFILIPKDYVDVKIEESIITFSLGRNDAPVGREDDEFLSLVLVHFIEVAERKFPHKLSDLIRVVNEVKKITTSDIHPKTQKGISDFLSRMN